MSYPQVIAAISAELQRRHVSASPESAHDLTAIVGEIVERQQAMPDYLRLPMRILTQVFDYWGFITTGTCFRKMDADKQVAQIEAWKSSRFDLCRNFVRFYESLYLLIVMQEDIR